MRLFQFAVLGFAASAVDFLWRRTKQPALATAPAPRVQAAPRNDPLQVLLAWEAYLQAAMRDYNERY